MANGSVTKRSAEALRCQAGKDRAFLWDRDLSGFGVAAFSTGRRFYVAQYRQSGRSRRITIGEHGRLTAEEARSKAKKLLASVALGADPLDERRAERAVPTFREIAEAYLTKHVDRHRKRATAAGYRTLLRLHILPAIGEKRVTEIRRSHVEAIHDALLGTPSAANSALSVISAVWTWAATKTYVDLNLPACPARGIQRNREESRERYLSVDELNRVGDVLRQAETDGLPYEVDEAGPKAKHAPRLENRFRRIDPFAIAAIRLLLFTGARLREILHAKWDEIDFERGLLNLSSARSKTGKKAIVLSAPALEILAALPRIAGNPHVIPGETTDKLGVGQPRYDLKAPWRAITGAAGLEGLRIHDLRHSHAATGAGLGLGLHMVGKLLGHSQPSTTARYAHLDADPVRKAANSIGAALAGALSKKNVAAIIEPGFPSRSI